MEIIISNDNNWILFKCSVYKYYAGIDWLDISLGLPQFIFMYSLMLVGSNLIIFLKPKQEQQELIQEKHAHLSGRLSTQEKELQKALALKGEFYSQCHP